MKWILSKEATDKKVTTGKGGGPHSQILREGVSVATTSVEISGGHATQGRS